MAVLSVATGVALLHDEGILPMNPARQAIAFTSPAEAIKLEGDGLAMRHTAAALAMEDQSAGATVELSSAAVQFLAQDLASPDATAAKALSPGALPQPSSYPYGGWASDLAPAPVSSSSSPLNLLA